MKSKRLPMIVLASISSISLWSLSSVVSATGLDDFGGLRTQPRMESRVDSRSLHDSRPHMEHVLRPERLERAHRLERVEGVHRMERIERPHGVEHFGVHG